MQKLTYVSAIEYALTNAEFPKEIAEKLEALKASLVKRNSADRKPTKTQKENEVIKADILSFLADGGAHTVSEIIEGTPSLSGASNQKASSLIRQLKDSGLIVRTEVKRKAYFSLA